MSARRRWRGSRTCNRTTFHSEAKRWVHLGGFGGGGLTSVDLPLHGLHPPRLLDDVVDELGRLLVPHLGLADPGLGQQLPQVGVKVVEVEAHVRDVPGGEEAESVERSPAPSTPPRRAHLNPLGAPMSALDSLEAFFLFFLSFFPLLLRREDEVGEGMER